MIRTSVFFRTWIFCLAAALGPLWAAETPEAPKKPARKPWHKAWSDSADFHDIVFITGGLTLGSPYARGHGEVFGVGYGVPWIDAYSSLRFPFYQGSAARPDSNAYLTLSSALSLTSIVAAAALNGYAPDPKDPLGYLAGALVFAPFAFYPEIRLGPKLPVYPVVGYNLDLAYAPRTSTFKTVAGVRAGLNVDILFLRLRSGYDLTRFGDTWTRGPYFGLDLFFGSFHAIMSI